MRIWKAERGFSLIELMTVLAIGGVITAVALPSTTRTVSDYRLRSDARAVHNLIGVAKMRAAARFTRVRLRVDLASDTFFLQYWDKTANDWVTEGGMTSLASGDGFDSGAMDVPPPSTQNVLAQSPNCLDNAGLPIASTGCIVFNSRGIPIDGATGTPFGNNAFYLTDYDSGVYAVTLSATPLVRLWWSPASHSAWVHR